MSERATQDARRGEGGAPRPGADHRERERTVRELHDTVAHHVSGIAVTGQAGRTGPRSRGGGLGPVGMRERANLPGVPVTALNRVKGGRISPTP